MRGGGGGGGQQEMERQPQTWAPALSVTGDPESCPPPPPEVHAGDQSVIGDIFLECQVDVTAGDQCSTGD